MAQKKGIRRSRRRRKQRQRKIMILSGFVLLCLIIVFAIIRGNLRRYVSKYPVDRVADNVYIGQIDVSGMSEEEVHAKLQEQNDVDTAFTVTVHVEDETVDLSLGELGAAYDMDDEVKEALDYGKTGSLWKRYRTLRKLKRKAKVIEEELIVDEEQAQSVMTEKVVPLTKHAENASISITAGEITIIPEEEGMTVNIEETINDLKKLLNDDWQHENLTLEATLETEEANIKEEDLAEITDELGSYATEAGSGERVTNIRVGMEKISGTVLMPGEEFSVNKATEPFDAEHGYVQAGSYENGRVVESYGGGICQVSTTLYNAVLYAELEVVERCAHSMLVTYVSPSRDAAIADDVKDFVFKNNYDTPVYIYGEIDANNQLRFAIYGKETRDPGRTVDFESETLETEEPGVTYVTNSSLYLGAMQVTSSAHTGKDAALWKIVYQDGKEVSREEINRSHYQKGDKIIEVGTKTDNASAASLVANAVSTQNASKIQAAIDQASSMR